MNDKRADFLDMLPSKLHALLERITDETDRLLSGASGALSPAQIEDVRIIHKACLRLSNIVNEIRDYVSLNKNKLDFDDEPIDIEEVANEVIETAQSESGKKNPKLVLKNDGQPPLRVRDSRDGLRRMKADILAGMSHDLRSPLNSVIGFTDLLLKEMEGPLTEDQRRSLLRMAKEAEKIMVLIADILDTSKLEAGQSEMERQQKKTADPCSA